MLQRDYLMQMISQFIQAIIDSRKTAQKKNPQLAADSLEDAIGNATDIDGATLLSLGPESIASVMQLSGVDPRVAGYIAYSLQLEAEYLQEAGNSSLAALRQEQANAVAETFMLDLEQTPAELEEQEASTKD
jgi:hypothetical protein